MDGERAFWSATGIGAGSSQPDERLLLLRRGDVGAQAAEDVFLLLEVDVFFLLLASVFFLALSR